MFCNKCGNQLPSDASFCTKCGAKIVPVNSYSGSVTAAAPPEAGKTEIKNSDKATKKSKGKKPILWIVLAALLLTMAICASAILLLTNRDLNKFESSVKDQNISNALQTYQDLSYEDRVKANEWLRDYIDSVEKSYYEGEYDFTSASAILNDTEKFSSVYNEASTALSRINLDNTWNIAYQSAQRYAEQSKWDQAYQALEGVPLEYRQYDEATAFRSQCANSFREQVLSQCSDLAAKSDYQELISNLVLALQILPTDTELSLKLQEYIDEFEEATLAQAKELADQGDYKGAVDLLSAAQEINYFSSFDNAMDEYEYLDLKTTCEEMQATSGYESVVSYLLTQKNATVFDSKRNDLFNSYAEGYINEVLALAKEKADKRDFAGAIQVLQNAKSVYDDGQFDNAITLYQAKLPIDLADCKVIDSQRLEVGDFEDAFGNTYKNAIENTMYGSYAHVVYYLNKNYTTLSGVIAIDNCEHYYSGNSVSGNIYFYLDGELAYETPDIIITTEPFPFEIDVTGCSQLEIYFNKEADYFWDWCAIVSSRLS